MLSTNLTSLQLVATCSTLKPFLFFREKSTSVHAISMSTMSLFFIPIASCNAVSPVASYAVTITTTISGLTLGLTPGLHSLIGFPSAFLCYAYSGTESVQTSGLGFYKQTVRPVFQPALSKHRRKFKALTPLASPYSSIPPDS